MEDILDEIAKTIDPETCKGILQDIEALLKRFQDVANVDSFRLLIATVGINFNNIFKTTLS